MPGSLPFENVLIANRGEIACRLIRATRRLRLRSVAVYSTPDAHAPHVRLADKAVHIGPAPSSASYLNAEKLIEAAIGSKAQALHPGYGFLSENASFVRMLEDAGITFVGPPAESISKMGDKITSKKIAESCGVNVIPGFVGEISSEDHAICEARKIMYPVMVKASAGGGGKGMRVAYSDNDVREAYRLSKAEAAKAFGDDRMLIEKFIEQPRHIEIQILGDMHGNYVHLGERECSVQRRNQKVIEESPSPIVDEKMREEMGRQAIALAKAVNYSSAGTVECLVSGVDRSFYFLEMNTRLQVEHPVTEGVTGADIPELMLRIAAGEKLPFTQSDLNQRGWAMEARIYAENPFRGFMPSLGTVFGYREPTQRGWIEESDDSNMNMNDSSPSPSAEKLNVLGFDPNGIRVDSGIEDGSVINSYYDPLLAKLIVVGATRAEAIEKLGAALDGYAICGVQTNIPFLRGVTQNECFRRGDLTTTFVEREYPDLVPGKGNKKAEEMTRLQGFGAGMNLDAGELSEAVSIVAGMYFKECNDLRGVTGVVCGNVGRAMMFEVSDAVGDKFVEGTVHVMEEESGKNVFEVYLRHDEEFPTDRKACVSVTIARVEELAGCEGAIVDACVNDSNPRTLWRMSRTPYGGEGVWNVSYRGAVLHVRVGKLEDEELTRKIGGWQSLGAEGSKHGREDGTIRAPMAGHVVSLSVQIGDHVGVGQEVAVLEAMKMQNSVKSNVTGIVSSLHGTRPGGAVSVDQVLVEVRIDAVGKDDELDGKS